MPLCGKEGAIRPGLRAQAWRERDEPGSGLLFDLGPHLIDQALLLFGAPQQLSADVRKEREGAIADDAFDVVLHYGEFRAVLGATMLGAAPGPRFLLYGTRGSFVKHGVDPQAEALKLGENPGGDRWGEESEDMWGRLSVAKEESIVAEQVPTEPGFDPGIPAYSRPAGISDSDRGQRTKSVRRRCPAQAAGTARRRT